MKREIKQYWSTISSISTKRTTTSHLKSLSLNAKKTMTYGIGNPCPSFGQAQQCGGVKLFNGTS
jgi:hypothetical protein